MPLGSARLRQPGMLCPNSCTRVAILPACYRARNPQNPHNTKKIQNPPPRAGPPKIRKKYRKNGLKTAIFRPFFRSRPGKPNQRKGQNEKFMNFAHFCEFWCLSLGKQARFTLNFCSGMPLRKVHELTFFGLVCRGHS